MISIVTISDIFQVHTILEYPDISICNNIKCLKTYECILTIQSITDMHYVCNALVMLLIEDINHLKNECIMTHFKRMIYIYICIKNDRNMLL